MDIRGFHVVSKLDANSDEGFSTTVKHPKTGEIRGPFGTIKEAVDCAHSWANEPAVSASHVAPTVAPEVADTTDKTAE